MKKLNFWLTKGPTSAALIKTDKGPSHGSSLGPPTVMSAPCGVSARRYSDTE